MEDLGQFVANIDKSRAVQLTRAKAIVDTILDDSDKTLFDWDLYKAIGNELGQRAKSHYDFSFMEQLYEGYLESTYSELLTYIDAVWRLQKDKSDAYGDADTYIEKIKNSKDVRVFTLKDIATCADENYFIIIQDLINKEVHVRVIWQYGDYPRKKYPHKLTLRFWRDREFIVDYVEKYHMTNLGSVYGDERDEGFVYSFSYNEWNIRRAGGRNVFFWAIQRRFWLTLHSVWCELTDREID